MRTVLVTGTAGFIGFHTAKRLLEQGQSVVGIDNLNDYYDVSLKQSRLEHLQSLQNHNSFSFEKMLPKSRQFLKRPVQNNQDITDVCGGECVHVCVFVCEYVYESVCLRIRNRLDIIL